MLCFEHAFHVPSDHSLEQVKTRSRGGVMMEVHWEHREYSTDGHFVARFESYQALDSADRNATAGTSTTRKVISSIRGTSSNQHAVAIRSTRPNGKSCGRSLFPHALLATLQRSDLLRATLQSDEHSQNIDDGKMREARGHRRIDRLIVVNVG
jgi:hypothetical protein